MKTTLYTFTGTGNSLWTARTLGGMLTDAELIPVHSAMKNRTDALSPSGAVGFICPVYYGGLPLQVVQMLETVDLSKASYIFAVVTAGLDHLWSLRQMDVILKKSGYRLDYGESVILVDNYLPLFTIPPHEDQKRIISYGLNRIKTIADEINRRKKGLKPGKPYARLAYYTIYQRYRLAGKGLDTKFSVDDRCNACETCIKVCPVKNITLEGGHPVWHHSCENCFACLHLCPVNAIDFGKRTGGKLRYHHPNIQVSELIKFQEEYL